MNIFVGCSSCEVSNYEKVAYKLGEELSKKGHTLVFGAAYVGLMKNLVDGFATNNGKIIGISPECYKEYDYKSCHKLIKTKTISERKMKLIEYSDAFVFLPGGFGTMDELLSVFEEKRGGYFDKPIILINADNYYCKFLEFVNEFVIEKMAKKGDIDLITVVNSVQEAVSYL